LIFTSLFASRIYFYGISVMGYKSSESKYDQIMYSLGLMMSNLISVFTVLMGLHLEFKMMPLMIVFIPLFIFFWIHCVLDCFGYFAEKDFSK